MHFDGKYDAKKNRTTYRNFDGSPMQPKEINALMNMLESAGCFVMLVSGDDGDTVQIKGSYMDGIIL